MEDQFLIWKVCANRRSNFWFWIDAPPTVHIGEGVVEVLRLYRHSRSRDIGLGDQRNKWVMERWKSGFNLSEPGKRKFMRNLFWAEARNITPSSDAKKKKKKKKTREVEGVTGQMWALGGIVRIPQKQSGTPCGFLSACSWCRKKRIIV